MNTLRLEVKLAAPAPHWQKSRLGRPTRLVRSHQSHYRTGLGDVNGHLNSIYTEYADMNGNNVHEWSYFGWPSVFFDPSDHWLTPDLLEVRNTLLGDPDKLSARRGKASGSAAFSCSAWLSLCASLARVNSSSVSLWPLS